MSKEIFIRNILKKYDLIVDFDGEPDLKNVPSPLEEPETFKNWCARVLKGCSNVRVFMPHKPAPQRKINRLQKEAQTHQLDQVFQAVVRLHAKKSRRAVTTAKEDALQKVAIAEEDALQKVVAAEDIAQRKVAVATKIAQTKYAAVSTETIEDIREQFAGELEPAVNEFLMRLSVSASKAPVDIETAMLELIKAYNTAAKRVK
jgi:hypothetical protein